MRSAHRSLPLMLLALACTLCLGACANRTRLAAKEPETIQAAVGQVDQLVTLHGVAAKSEAVTDERMTWMILLHDPNKRWVQRQLVYKNVRSISLPTEDVIGWTVVVETTVGRYSFHFEKGNPRYAAEFRAAFAKLVRNAGGDASYPED